MVPESRRRALVQRMHGGQAGAYFGSVRTLALVKHGFYWPGMMS